MRTEQPHREFVLREFPAGDTAAHHEERALTALGALRGLAPRLIARGAEDGRDRVLISRSPGVAGILPADPEDRAVQLGRALARVHGAVVSSRLDRGPAQSSPGPLRGSSTTRGACSRRRIRCWCTGTSSRATCAGRTAG